MVTTISGEVSFSTPASTPSGIGELAMEVIKKFAESYDKDTKSNDNIEQEAKAIIGDVDTDKNGTVSLNELNSFDLSQCSFDRAKKITDLTKNFKNYDKDGNGELALNEIKDALRKKEYSIQELGAMAAEAKPQEKNQLQFGNLSDSFFQKLVNNYKDIGTLNPISSFEV